MKNSILLLIIGLIFTACLNEPQLPALTNDFGLNNAIPLTIHTESSISKENIRLKFLNVRDESRCPPTWKCLWKGEADIEILFQKGTITKVIRLKYEGGDCTDCGEMVRIMGYKIKLEKLTPYPDANFFAKMPLHFDHYEIVLRVENDENEVYL